MSTSVGESVVAKRVYINCPIMLTNRDSYVEQVKLDMLDFDVNLGVDWFHACIASIDCRTKVVKLTFQMSPFYSGREEIHL